MKNKIDEFLVWTAANDTRYCCACMAYTMCLGMAAVLLGIWR